MNILKKRKILIPTQPKGRRTLILYQKVISALHTNCLINCDKITARLKDRRVYLEGAVGSESERNPAAKCVGDIFGIRAMPTVSLSLLIRDIKKDVFF